MASIEITPLNIAGIKLPFDLLDNLLGESVDVSQLVYPLDLATNPQYCHAIQFSVHDYTYPAAESVYQGINGLINSGANLGNNALKSLIDKNISNTTLKGLAGDVGSAFGSFVSKLPTIGREIPGIVSRGYTSVINANIASPFQKGQGAIRNINPADVTQFANKVAQLTSPGSYKPNVLDEKLATISLYLPDTLQTSFQSDWTDTSLTKAFGLTGYLGNAITDTLGSTDPNKTNPAQIIQNPTLDSYKRQFVSSALGGLLGDDGKSILQNQLKNIPNPQIQLLYRGIALRTFQFEFTFTPASAKEAYAIDQIIKTFTYYSLPDITDGASGQFFTPPQVFRIKFAFLGNDGVAGRVFDVFKNTIGNLIGNQFTKLLSGSDPTSDIAQAAKSKIFEIGDCVLKDVSVNYAPNGWASYSDGYPIQTVLSLTFSEMNLVTKKSNGVKPDKTGAYDIIKNLR